MVEKKEKLTKDIVNLYSFVKNVFFEGMEHPTLMHRLNKKEGMFLERQSIQINKLDNYVDKTIAEYVNTYFKDFMINQKLFDGYKEEQKNHLIDLCENIEKVKENTTNRIYKRFFRLSMQDKSYIETAINLENAVNEVISSTNNSIESINRQLGYSMILYDYENQGFKKYRLISSDDSCFKYASKMNIQ